MDDGHRQSAETARRRIESGDRDPAWFRAALAAVPASRRDAWVDLVFGLVEHPDDGPELPRGCVPYLPCAVDALLQIVDHAPVRGSDVFVDIGAGIGRAASLVHLLTGAPAIGLEIQPRLVSAARDLAARLGAPQVSYRLGDAPELMSGVGEGSVFFLYCPFSGERLARVLADLERIAVERPIRVCAVDIPLPPCPWLTLTFSQKSAVAIYESRGKVV